MIILKGDNTTKLYLPILVVIDISCCPTVWLSSTCILRTVPSNVRTLRILTLVLYSNKSWTEKKENTELLNEHVTIAM